MTIIINIFVNYFVAFIYMSQFIDDKFMLTFTERFKIQIHFGMS